MAAKLGDSTLLGSISVCLITRGYGDSDIMLGRFVIGNAWLTPDGTWRAWAGGLSATGPTLEAAATAVLAASYGNLQHPTNT